MNVPPAPLRRATAALLAALVLTGCVTSMKPAGTRPSGDEGAGVALAVFADDDARSAGLVAPSRIASVLERRDGRDWQAAFRSLSSRWAVGGLPPGEYRLRITGILDEAGKPQPIRELRQKVRVREGEIVDVEVVLEHVSPALVAVGVATAVVAAVLLFDWLEDHDLPTPPPPPPGLVEAVVHVAIDVAAAPCCDGPGAGPVPPPFVTSTFPVDGGTVAAGRSRVVFVLSEPLASGALPLDAVSVEGEVSGPIPGRTVYDAPNWWVVWVPDEALPPGEVFHAYLDPGGLPTRGGRSLASAPELSFRTP